MYLNISLNDEQTMSEDPKVDTTNFSLSRFIPYEVAMCTSTQSGFDMQSLCGSTYKSGEWRSERMPCYPVTTVIRFPFRAEVEFLVVESPHGYEIDNIIFSIADPLRGRVVAADFKNFVEISTRGKMKSPQVEVRATGSAVRIEMWGHGYGGEYSQNTRNQPVPEFKDRVETSFGQLGLSSLKFWGSVAGPGHWPLSGDYWLSSRDRSRLSLSLLNLGLDFEFQRMPREFLQSQLRRPTDEFSRLTIDALLSRRTEMIECEDFVGAAGAASAAVEVAKLGARSAELRVQLEIAVHKENYDDAQRIKGWIEEIKRKVDAFNLKFETEVWEKEILLGAEFEEEHKRKLELEEAERERLRLILLERQRKQLEMDTGQALQAPPSPPPPITTNPSTSNRRAGAGGPRRFLKRGEGTRANLTRGGPNRNESARALRNNPTRWGPAEFDAELRRRLAASGCTVPKGLSSNCPELLSGLQRRGLLSIFGESVWSASHDTDWRVRHAACESLLTAITHHREFTSDPTTIFNAFTEIALIFCGDKVSSVFRLGLKVLRVCFGNEILNSKVDRSTQARCLYEALRLLGGKVAEINMKNKHVALYTIIGFFDNTLADMQTLFGWLSEPCDKTRDLTLFGKHHPPIAKQAAKTIQPRLEVLAQILMKFSKLVAFDALLAGLAGPALGHPDAGVKSLATEVVCLFYQKNKTETLRVLAEQDMNPHLAEWINVRFKELDRVAGEKKKIEGEDGERSMKVSGIQGIGKLIQGNMQDSGIDQLKSERIGSERLDPDQIDIDQYESDQYDPSPQSSSQSTPQPQSQSQSKAYRVKKSGLSKILQSSNFINDEDTIPEEPQNEALLDTLPSKKTNDEQPTLDNPKNDPSQNQKQPLKPIKLNKKPQKSKEKISDSSIPVESESKNEVKKSETKSESTEPPVRQESIEDQVINIPNEPKEESIEEEF